MTILPYTDSNVQIVQDFIDETCERISKGTEITFTQKALNELEDLSLNYNITTDDIEYAILNLQVSDYHRGIDVSNRSDFNICAFRTTIGVDNLEIYLKYGIEAKGLQILVFSNHPPRYPMVSPFRQN